jgi:hypothetical protein
MRRTRLLARAISTVLLVGSLLVTRATTQPPSDCPSVFVSCSDTCGSLCDFAVSVNGAKLGQKLSYSWKVNKGKIKSGQGTDKITVDLRGFGEKDRTGVTATVEIGGIDESCSNAASCTTGIP